MSRSSPDSGPLLQCPFCGEQPVFPDYDAGDNDFVVMCKSCGSSSRYSDVQADVIASWNTRKSDLAPTAADEQPVAWHCFYRTHGHITLRRDEAEAAAAEGATVRPMIYAASPVTSTDRALAPAKAERWPTKGDRMIFLNEHGYPEQRKRAAKAFEVGKEYEVDACDVGDWSHSVRFVGVEGWHNGVMFKRVSVSSPVHTREGE